MISRLRGIVVEKQPPLALLEIGGLGYEIYMPITCFYELPDIGKEAIIFTQCVVCKDTQLLYGFNNKLERILFRELVKINGIGPKLALTILSGISVKQFINAIECKDSATLVKLPGVGKKTAERLIVEMKYRFNNLYYNQFTSSTDLLLMTSAQSLTCDAEQEAIAALMALGYKYKEANCMVNKVAKPNASSETLIREALRAEL